MKKIININNKRVIALAIFCFLIASSLTTIVSASIGNRRVAGTIDSVSYDEEIGAIVLIVEGVEVYVGVSREMVETQLSWFSFVMSMNWIVDIECSDLWALNIDIYPTTIIPKIVYVRILDTINQNIT
jgi:hypothetical protein